MAGLLAVTLAVTAPTAARAQTEAGGRDGRPRVALLTTSTARTGAEAERDAALDAVVHAALDELDVASAVARPALDLESIQLSIDCVGETPACLRAVAEKLDSDVLLAPAIRRTADALVIDILYFDAQRAELRRVSRRQAGDTLSAETLDAVPGMLRELFQLEPEAPEAAAEPRPPPEVPPPDAVDIDDAWVEPDEGRGVPIGPIALAGGGLAVLGAGIAFGLAANDSEDEYAAIDVTSPAQAERADDELDQARRQALAANLLIGAGAAALAASAIWLAIDLSGRGGAGETALRPVLSPGHAGVVLRGAWGGAP